MLCINFAKWFWRKDLKILVLHIFIELCVNTERFVFIREVKVHVFLQKFRVDQAFKTTALIHGNLRRSVCIFHVFSPLN